jgi:hypothetical protein
MEKTFKDSRTIASNTLYLGNSNNFEASNSLLNKNITINNQNKNETLYDYNNKFFDNSIINNINSGITMTTLLKGK